MHRFLFLTFLCCLSFSVVSAQASLEGLWEGTISVGGLNADSTYKFELYIVKEGKQLTGRSYLHLDNGEVVEMEVSGPLYGDLSIYLLEKNFVPQEGSAYNPPFFRKYQLMYKPSIWKTKMEGFWQEITPNSYYTKRELGRIELQKADTKKA